MGKYVVHTQQELELMPDEEYERLGNNLVEAFEQLEVKHSTLRGITELESLLSKVEALREAPKWTLGKSIYSMAKKQSGKVHSALKKAEKLRDQLVSELNTIVGDGMLVFEEPVVCPPKASGEEPYSFNRIYIAELWDDDECEYNYYMSCDSGYYDFDESLSPYDLPLATLVEIFNRIEWGEARWFSEEEVAACDGQPTIEDAPAVFSESAEEPDVDPGDGEEGGD